MTSGAAGDTWAEAAELNNRGLALVAEGRLEQAVLAYQRAVEVSRAAGHRKAVATALDNLSVTTAWLGRIEDALAAHGEALATFRSLGDVAGESSALSNLAAIHVRAGRSQAAIAAQLQAIEVCRAAGNWSAEGLALSHLGQILAVEGNLAGSIQAHQEAAHIWHGLADRDAEAGELQTLALRLAEARRYTAARQVAQQAVAVLLAIGRPAEAATLRQWLEALPATGAEEPGDTGRDARTAGLRSKTVRGCVPFLAAVGAVVTFASQGPWVLVAVLTGLAALGWGTCLTSLASLAMGAVVVWKSWGTWWLLGGLALLVFGVTSLASDTQVRRTGTQARLGMSTRLDPSESGGQEGRRHED